MSTDLTTTAIEGSEISVFNPDSDLRETMASNFEAGESMRFSDLPKANFKSKPFSVKIGGANKSLEYLEGILVFRGASWSLWGDEDNQGGSLPFITSVDGITGFQRGDDAGTLDVDLIEEHRTGDGTYDLRKLPYMKWEKSNGRNIPPRVKEYRHLCILPLDGIYPIHLQVPSTSIGIAKDFVRKLELPFYRTIVKIGLNDAKSRDGKRSYFVIDPSVVGSISAEEGKAVMSAYTTPLKEAFRENVIGNN